SLRLWLSLPIFMIEKKACMESVRESWRITKGKLWSILFVNIVLGLVVGVIQNMVLLPFALLSIPYVGEVITYIIFIPLSLILPTAYYYSIKAEERKKV
ncbi:MAG: glycerophosphoryl diester phosphodiesterase membrane domain-containing protein, partial [Candidatus Aenigmarchaeota archaeon]|nr:glycerophosphoryl diester phosphodiesterase membrane domain-containing protein [Candidatus Aenigmarchaeota archaeon]